MRVYALAKPVREARQRLAAIDRRMDEIKELVDEAELGEADRTRIEAEAEQISEELETLEEDFGQANRMGRQTGGIENWSGRPSADQLWSIDQTWDAIPAVIERINAMLTGRMPAFEAMLSDAGVQPSLGEPIRVPTRR